MRSAVSTAIILAHGALVACVDEAGVLECPGSLVESMRSDGTDIPIAWSTEGCIITSYDPDFESIRGDIEYALDAWQSVDCGDLCFSEPYPLDEPSGTRTFHFERRTENRPPDVRNVTRTVYGTEDGLIRQAVVEIDETIPAEKRRRHLLRSVGLGLGFRRAVGAVESVLNEPDGDMLEDLTEADRNAYCAKYGSCD